MVTSSLKSITEESSLKRVIRKGWFVAYMDLNKEKKIDSDSARIWGSKWILLHVVLSAHAH